MWIEDIHHIELRNRKKGKCRKFYHEDIYYFEKLFDEVAIWKEDRR